ncbi:FG-GAP repeat domain-containing protein [Amycolatopsis sp. CA-230715]|uniref:FG-GAP repeat domain-containing protein n=1 Tax=Amycolatopsis sp. CA-230715 TaxID=2745196 RepID=UPI001C03229B|nr:VCBS repeat-containing protein [Amycolatopsis sp. CA-230715]QWF82560.1 hypothetical protein HUW46_05998 [Amycolatopsis sp. CA-230715]
MACTVALLAGIGTAGTASAAAPSFQVRDFTLDGKEDLGVRTEGGALVVHPHSGRFDGTKTLKNGVPINYGWSRSAWISAADFTGDGNADVIEWEYLGGNIRMYPHSGHFDGTNTLGPREVNFTDSNRDHRFFARDFTGDGLADLLVLEGDGNLYLMRNTGRYGNQRFAPVERIGTGFGGADWIDAADLNGDGRPEVLARWADRVFAFEQFNGGYTGLTGPRPGPVTGVTDFGGGWSGSSIALKDMTLDGRPDLVLLGSDARRVLTVHANQGGLSPRTFGDSAGGTVISEYADANLMF